jgi:hypothetical protein
VSCSWPFPPTVRRPLPPPPPEYYYPKLAYDPLNDRFLAVYEKVIYEESTASRSVYGKFVLPDGGDGSDEFQISDSTANPIFIASAGSSSGVPCLAYDGESGRFLVAWEDYRFENVYIYGIHGRLVDADETSIGNDLIISGEYGGMAPSVAYNTAYRNFLVAYNTYDSTILFSAVGEPSPYPTGLALDSTAYSLPVGDTHSTVVTAVYSDSSSFDATDMADHSSDNPGIASVEASGLVTGISPGNTVITAFYGDLKAQAEVTVTALPTPQVVSGSMSPMGAGVPTSGSITAAFDPAVNDMTGGVTVLLAHDTDTSTIYGSVIDSQLTAPYSGLLPGTLYTVTIPAQSVQSTVYGTFNGPVSWTFTTAAGGQLTGPVWRTEDGMPYPFDYDYMTDTLTLYWHPAMYGQTPVTAYKIYRAPDVYPYPGGDTF